MARTIRRLYGPVQLPNTTGTRYTVPANTKTRLDHIRISNPTGGAVTFTASVGADAAGTRFYDAYSVAAGSVLDVYPGIVMEETEVLAMHASAATSLVAIVDGTEHTLG